MAKTCKWILDAAADQANDQTFSSTGSSSAKAKEFLEIVYDEILSELDYDFLERDFFINTIAKITAGTVSTTAGSATITGSGTSFTAAMVGYVIKISGDNQTYRVASFTSSTSIDIEGTAEKTLSGASYEMGKDRYLIPKFVRKPLNLRLKSQSDYLEQMDVFFFDRVFANVTTFADPVKWFPFGVNTTTYSTGTCSGTSGANVITGSGTSWDTSGIQQYHVIRVGSYAYTIKSIDSATQLTVYEDLVVTIDASTSYVVDLDNWVAQVYPIRDIIRVMTGKGITFVPPFVDDSDVPIIPQHHIGAIVNGLVQRIRRHNQEDPSVDLIDFKKSKSVMKGASTDRKHDTLSWTSQSRRGVLRRY